MFSATWQPLKIEVFGEQLHLGESAAIAKQLPRTQLEKFDLRNAQFGENESQHFIAALAKEYPRIVESLALLRAVRKVDQTPVAICLESIDPGLRNAYYQEGVPFISEDGNAYLPFLGIQQKPGKTKRPPAPLSPQAQRIALNLLAGRWVNRTASELAELCGKSRPSATKYLQELEAIRSGLTVSSWKSRTLVNPWSTKEELLDAIEPYLKSPVQHKIRLKQALPKHLLANHGAKLTGMSALSFFSDLAYDATRLDVMMEQDEITGLKQEAGEEWQQASWSEDAPLVIETWTYPLDATSRISLASTGLECVDPYSLYAELLRENHDDVRIIDAIEQLRGEICQ